MDVTIVQQQLEIPVKFQFPFEPYQIQNDFMKNLYSVIENGKLGIFESPTGTGKSLSIICGTLKWLKDHEIRVRTQLNTTVELLKKEKDNVAISSEDWLFTQSKEIELSRKLQQIQLEISKLDKNDEKIAKLKSRQKGKNIKTDYLKQLSEKENKKGVKDLGSDDSKDENEDEEFLLEDYAGEESDPEDEEAEEYEGVQVFICSRTHSQIAQLVREVKRSPFANDIRLVTLASRQSYCINPDVNKLRNPTLINEKCLDLQRSGKGKATASTEEGQTIKKKRTACRCPYMQSKAVEELKESALVQVQDVEELVVAGKKLNGCPYYAARSALSMAQVVLLPYNILLHKSTREASGIKLKNNIVIIDEAHNLLEALADMHSAQINGHQLTHAQHQLTEYKNRYKNKFTAQNLLYINQLLFIFRKLINMLGGKSNSTGDDKCSEENSKLYTLQDFLETADIDNLNMHKLLKFCSQSKISQKLNGFSLKYQLSVVIKEVKKETKKLGVKEFLKEISINAEPLEEESLLEKEKLLEEVPRNSFLVIIAFLEALVHKCEDGRVICIKQNTIGKGVLKFLLLNPSSHFKDIVNEARSVLVAGGTMQPVSEFKDRLFISSGALPDRITEFSCDHIVPPENILPIALLKGPTGLSLDFSFTSRNSNEILNEFGRVLQNMCSIIPGGIVCFFPSYQYEKLVYDNLEKSKVLQQLSVKKQIFREPKQSSDVDKTLALYAKAIKFCAAPKTGALMFSVVGGKLSEGLNFSDELGRCVVVVGLPYPNIKSPELQEKMSYLNKNEGLTAGNIFYENLCMKAVNQCIGRAVRHRNDYATVILLDQRYSRAKTQQALPSWIQRSLITHDKFGLAFAAISKVRK